MMRAEINKSEDAPSPADALAISYELTIHCTLCNYKMAQGGLTEPANLDTSEVLSAMQHNPRCVIQIKGSGSVGSDVVITDTSNVTNYQIYKL